jgi:hypothetical protein
MPNLTTCGTWRRENNKNRHGFNSQFVHHFSMASGESSSHLQLGVRMPFMPFANPTWLVMEKSPLFSTKKGTTSTNWSNRPCSSNFHGYVSLPEGIILYPGLFWWKQTLPIWHWSMPVAKCSHLQVWDERSVKPESNFNHSYVVNTC